MSTVSADFFHKWCTYFEKFRSFIIVVVIQCSCAYILFLYFVFFRFSRMCLYMFEMSMQSKSTICLFRSQHEMHSQTSIAIRCTAMFVNIMDGDETLIKCTHTHIHMQKKELMRVYRGLVGRS